MEHGHLHHFGVGPSVAGGGGGSERFPQWSGQETQDLVMIRGELDQTFMETKRNKILWEVVSTKMKERGYNRTAEQCKAKWKNLVTRYKGCDHTMEHDGTRQQFPFFNDLQVIFSTRMQRMQWMEAEGLVTSSKKRPMHFSSDDEDDDDNEDLEKASGGKGKKAVKSGINGNNHGSSFTGKMKEMLEGFMKQQREMELEWMKMFEAKEEERRRKEIEWRQKMAALEEERVMLDRRWREKEERRMMREEERSERRDALVTALLNRLN